MSEQFAIEVRNVTKQFSLSAGSASLKHAVIDFFKRGRRDTFTALRDVSFSVGQGETLGIIGANGAGKSTLLSIIAKTMTPTSGSVVTRGVVSSLLELGAGFHPDLTGRENVYLYGAIMGIPKARMRAHFNDIVDFSGLARFIDQPVRFYSSGMYVRLGFAVAVQVNPDILLIDEVLAVGDVDFQRRCLDKMAEFRKQGKSLLIISHDMNTIRSISDRIVFLDHGEMKGIGAPDEQVSNYQTTTVAACGGRREWGTGEAKITAVELINADGSRASSVGGDYVVRAKVTYSAPRRIDAPTFGFSIEDADGATVFGSNTELGGLDIPFIEGAGSVIMEIDVDRLRTGSFVLSFSLHSRDHKTNYSRIERALPFFLPQHREFDGVAMMPVKFRMGDAK